MKKLIFYLVLMFFVSLWAIASDGSTSVNAMEPRKTPLSNYSNAIILRWNEVAFETLQGPAYNPMTTSRVMAMMHIAMHDALNNIAPEYETYSFHGEDKKADPIAAASMAAHSVLVGSYPDKKQAFDAALAQAIKDLKDGNAKERGLSLGLQAGRAILSLRSNDGAFADPVSQVTNPDKPGLYQAVPPMPILFAPFWATLPTFGLTSPDQFRVGPMPSLTSAEYTTAFNEVKSKGAKENSTRTAEETAIAKYWYEFSEIGWNRVTRVAAQDAKLDLLTTARLFALVNIALADSYIAGWDSKLFHNFWRPYTAIRKAANDTNDKTMADSTWEPLMPTPPIHDYPSTHSVLGSAAATVLSEMIGRKVGFTMASSTAEPANHTRTFKSFTAAAMENAESRVLAGLHFRFSCDSGLMLGKQIGYYVLGHKLKKRSHANP